MKKYKKTYAIFHLTEKHTVFRLGKTKVHVSFTGGIVTKRGVTPATFTTDDPIVQLAIEQSADFKRGAISIRSKYPLAEEVKIGKNEYFSGTEGAGAVANQAIGEDSCEEDPAGGEIYSGTEDAGAVTDQAIGEASCEPEAMPTIDEKYGEKEGELEVVEASCKDVAKQYLQEHFGERPAPLRTIADVQECAAKYGLTFKFV